MKLVTLNIWGGRAFSDLEAFFDTYKDVDIWCFQEVFHNHTLSFGNEEIEGLKRNHNLFAEIAASLPDHRGVFTQCFENTYGNAIFYRSSLSILGHGEQLVAKGDMRTNLEKDSHDHDRKAQWAEIGINDKEIAVINTHLTHRPEGKQDSEKRIQQSNSLLYLLSFFEKPLILAGDFNLLPNTESIGLIENAGYKNLIKEFNIESTRTSYYKKPLRFADYIFVSKEIEVNDFKVLPEEVSDHSALLVDFDIK